MKYFILDMDPQIITTVIIHLIMDIINIESIILTTEM